MRDIYVLDTLVEDWQKLTDCLRSREWELDFSSDNGAPTLPQDISMLFDKARCPWALLSVKLGKVTLDCHFFSPEEIELSLVPNEVQSHVEAEQIFDFMRQIGRWLGKEIIFTPENAPNIPIFKFLPATDELKYFPVLENYLK